MNKRVLFDSSVWVASLVINANNHYEAIRLTKRYINRGYKLIVPWIILTEVVNVSNRLEVSTTKVNDFISEVMGTQEIIIPNIDPRILFETCSKLSKQAHLKSLDLLIIAHVKILKPIEFTSFDIKQMQCYNQLVKK